MGGSTPHKINKNHRFFMKVGSRAATDISIRPFFTKFYGEKDGDTPQIPNIDFSRFMSIMDGLILGGYPPHVRVSLQGMIWLNQV